MTQVLAAEPAQRTALCIVCGADLAGRTAFPVPGGRLAACKQCSSWTQFPRPNQDALSAFHDSEAYFDHPYLQLRRENAGGQQRRCSETFERLSRVVDTSTLRDRPMLDVGCDDGGLLQAAAAQYGVVPFGLDVSARAIAAAEQRGITTHHGILETAPPAFRDFALITGIDLIEHVADPQHVLREMANRLAPDGIVFLETPNLRSLTYRLGYLGSSLSGGRPRSLVGRLFPDEHVQYFSAAGIATLAAAAGFEMLHVSSRPIPRSELALSPALRTVLGTLQACDRATGEHTLLCAILRPVRESHS